MGKIVCFLFILISCGNADDDFQRVQLSLEENVDNFSTRLNNILLVEGARCEGDEVLNCDRDNWLITIDNVNTCTDSGVCTEVGIIPIVAELKEADESSFPEAMNFEIVPLGSVSPNQQAIIDDVYIRLNIFDDDTEVVFR